MMSTLTMPKLLDKSEEFRARWQGLVCPSLEAVDDNIATLLKHRDEWETVEALNLFVEWAEMVKRKYMPTPISSVEIGMGARLAPQWIRSGRQKAARNISEYCRLNHIKRIEIDRLGRELRASGYNLGRDPTGSILKMVNAPGGVNHEWFGLDGPCLIVKKYMELRPVAPQPKTSDISRLYRQGVPQSEIARMVGVTRQRVGAVVQEIRSGIKPHRGRPRIHQVKGAGGS